MKLLKQMFKNTRDFGHFNKVLWQNKLVLKFVWILLFKVYYLYTILLLLEISLIFIGIFLNFEIISSNIRYLWLAGYNILFIQFLIYGYYFAITWKFNQKEQKVINNFCLKHNIINTYYNENNQILASQTKVTKRKRPMPKISYFMTRIISLIILFLMLVNHNTYSYQQNSYVTSVLNSNKKICYKNPQIFVFRNKGNLWSGINVLVKSNKTFINVSADNNTINYQKITNKIVNENNLSNNFFNHNNDYFEKNIIQVNKQLIKLNLPCNK